MPYKTILVHLNDKNRAEALLEPAVRLPQTVRASFDRHQCVSARSGAANSASLRNSGSWCHGSSGTHLRRPIAIIFSRMSQPFTMEGRAEKSQHFDLARVVIQHRLAADLIVAVQAASDCPIQPCSIFRSFWARKRATRAYHSALGRIHGNRQQ